MTKTISVAPDKRFGLQKDFTNKFSNAYQADDDLFFHTLEAFLKASGAQKEEFIKQVLNRDVSDTWFNKLQIEAEKIGARLHVIKNLKVDYSIPHNEAAMTGGPQTPSNYNVLKVADKYRVNPELVTETIVLLNYPNGGGKYQRTVEWGLQNGLRETTPHVPFAIGEQFPNLNYELGPNPMYVVETTGCSWNDRADACFMWWLVDKREASLLWQSYFGGDDGWFAFCK